MSLRRVHVIGAGAWGTALAQVAAVAGREVTLVARDPELAIEINKSHCNSRYLGKQKLADRIFVQTGFAGLADADIVLMAAPAQTTRAVLGAIGGKPLGGKPVVLCAKGLESQTMARQSEILKAIAPDATALALSGPSFAADVAAGRPTAVTLAGEDIGIAEDVAAALAGPTFRPYAGADLIGVELAGGLKNVYAIACGAVEGAGLGLSARSALLARAFAELSRLVVRMGGQATTLTGLAGLGDLTLSCTSEQSRNYWYGVRLGRGRKIADLQNEGGGLAEGIKTAPAAQALAKKYKVDAPLIEAVNLLLEGKTSIATIVQGLMTRPLKRETEQ